MTTLLVANIEASLLEKGWSMRELCRRANLNVSAVHDILKGRASSPKLETVEKIASALGTQVTTLLSDGKRTKAEKAILDAFADLPEADQEKILSIARAWSAPKPE